MNVRLPGTRVTNKNRDMQYTVLASFEPDTHGYDIAAKYIAADNNYSKSVLLKSDQLIVVQPSVGERYKYHSSANEVVHTIVAVFLPDVLGNDVVIRADTGIRAGENVFTKSSVVWSSMTRVP